MTGKKGHGDAAVTASLPVTSSSSTDLLAAQCGVLSWEGHGVIYELQKHIVINTEYDSMA